MTIVLKYLKFNILFVLIFLAQVYSLNKPANPGYSYIAVLTPVSLAVLLVICTGLHGRFHRRLLNGLLVLLLATLMISRPHTTSSFTLGLLCLIPSHLFFTSAFYLDFLSAPELDKKTARIAICMALVLSFSCYLFFRPHLNAYKIPVLVYTFVISLMFMMSVFRRLRVNRLSFILVLSGTLLMIVADVLLALNRFVDPSAYTQLAGMAAYMVALYLIVIGGIERRLIRID